MIIDYDVNSTIGHGRGYPTGLEHSEKMDVIACLLDEGDRSYVNEEHTAWICSDQCAVGEMVTLDESSTMKAAILFIASSGCARAETLSLTIQDYIDALAEYLPRRKMNIFEVINLIEDDETIIPTFNIRRKKTNKYYTTYCSPEAVKAINAHILSRSDNVTNESKLFKMGVNYFTISFQKINDDLGLGKIGPYNRFRSHMLRKFHASALYNDGMSLDDVNDLQGKAKNKTDQAYFMINPEDLKYQYIEHLSAVTINTEVKKLHVKSPEFIKIENEKNELMLELDRLKFDIDSLKSMIGK